MNPVSLMLSLLKKHDLCAYIINLSDPHLSEFIAESDKHLEKLTGFTGSNGLAIVSEKEKVLYTDGRYFIQAKNELTDFKLKKYSVDEKVNEYLLNNFNDCIVGIDKSRISFKEFSDLQDKLKIKNVNLKHFFVDEFVKGMPERKFHSVIDLEKKHISDFYICDDEKSIKPQESFLSKEISYCDRKLEKFSKTERIFSDNPEINALLVKANNLSGSFREEKLKKVIDSLEEDALLITELDTIAWLLNLRGKDIPYNPVFFSYLLLTKEKPILFTNTKVNLPNLEIKKYSEIQEELKKFKKILVNGECNALLIESMTDYKFSDEINLEKSKKNEVEIEGMKLAHILDGLSLCLLFGWLEKNIGSVSEKEVSDKLVEIKKRFKAFYSESFETICGGGKNAAIIHHKVGNDILHKDEMILLDSGTQYFFGTTDVTRTLHFGTPSSEQKVNYTRVLKGFLLAKSANLPKKQKLSAIDILSRIFLWKDFLDFNHSTSHGVGHFLNVHEQPPSYNDTLSPNQVISIEPGYYKENEYGIRIEDLVYVEEKNDFYKFDSLTVVPFHRKLIDISLLSDEEKGLINEYNNFVRSKLQSILEGTEGYDYLMSNTEKI